MSLFADWPVFLGLTLCLFGGGAWLVGQAVAMTWRSYWQVIGYGVLLGAFDRFLHWGLFAGELLSVPGFLRDTALIIAIGLLSWRRAKVERMVTQYPWLYVKAGPLAWRDR
ncbi:MAG TPA: hypothetical protein VLN73_07435 [Alphaproteobacteria bacterium]|nr:hypothetical protein [Alphaproteobacteria bacterium]